MAKLTADISMSLDGFITDPNAGVGNSLGDDPGRLHDWMFDAKTEVLLGEGIRLFEGLGSDCPELRRTGLIETPRAMHLRFDVVKRQVRPSPGPAATAG